jgi:hypothetical protein
MTTSVNVILLLVGIVLLFAGRRMYWLFVGAVGFWLGLVLAQEFFRPEGLPGATDGHEWGILIGVLGGIVGAILAVLFQKVAVGLAGAAAGAFGGWVLFEAIGAESAAWLGMIIGAVLGGIVVLRLFDWGLIVFSSLAGARLIVDGIQMDQNAQPWVFLAGFVVGVAVQGTQLARARAEVRRSEAEQKRD